MLARIRRHATYANVVATIALILAVGGGTAYALQGRNTVFSNDIAPDQVRGVDARESSFKMRRLLRSGTSGESGASGEILTAPATCPAGYSVTGGGFGKSHGDIKITQNAPFTTQTNRDTWIAVGESTAGGQTLFAHAICERGRTAP